MDIEKDNELLAKFLGYSRKVVKYRERIWNSSDEYYWDWTEGELWVDASSYPIDDENDTLKFHYDWNSLMKVVEKIRSYPNYNDMEECSVSIERFEINRYSMFMSFTKFINGEIKIGASYHAFVENEPDASDSESFIEVIYKSCVDFVKFIN